MNLFFKERKNKHLWELLPETYTTGRCCSRDGQIYPKPQGLSMKQAPRGKQRTQQTCEQVGNTVLQCRSTGGCQHGFCRHSDQHKFTRRYQARFLCSHCSMLELHSLNRARSASTIVNWLLLPASYLCFPYFCGLNFYIPSAEHFQYSHVYCKQRWTAAVSLVVFLFSLKSSRSIFIWFFKKKIKKKN